MSIASTTYHVVYSQAKRLQDSEDYVHVKRCRDNHELVKELSQYRGMSKRVLGVFVTSDRPETTREELGQFILAIRNSSATSEENLDGLDLLLR